MSLDEEVFNCLSDEEEIIENIIEEENMETTVKENKTEYTYANYLQMIEAEEKVIEKLNTDIEAYEAELEDINISIDLAEAERLNKIKSVYSDVVNRRKDKETRLEELEELLDERREYLSSLNYETPDEDELIDRQYREVGEKEINEDSKSWFLDDSDEPQSKENNVYHIEDNIEYQEKVKEAVYFINDDDMAS